MAAAISLMVELLPAFAKNVTHVNEREVGIVFALDAVGVTLFQLPVVKQHAPHLLWPLAAAVNLACAAGALALERRLPPAVRVTPAHIVAEVSPQP
jgi:hypothetical protein